MIDWFIITLFTALMSCVILFFRLKGKKVAKIKGIKLIDNCNYNSINSDSIIEDYFIDKTTQPINKDSVTLPTSQVITHKLKEPVRVDDQINFNYLKNLIDNLLQKCDSDIQKAELDKLKTDINYYNNIYISNQVRRCLCESLNKLIKIRCKIANH